MDLLLTLLLLLKQWWSTSHEAYNPTCC